MDNRFASAVATHYNQVEQKPIRERAKSHIIELRRFNNAMKSLMHYIAFKFLNYGINQRTSLRVLDLGCGKGGDLPKYQRNDKIGMVVGVDIADVSIEQCKQRYKSMQKGNPRCFEGKFFVADLTRVALTEALLRSHTGQEDLWFHVVSSQFSLHYSFESYDQAVRYIKNAAMNLKATGMFIGTYPDGPKLLKLARESTTPGLYEVDDILSVKFDAQDLENPKPFGTKYHFKLKEVVDCPEFLVHPEILEMLMKALGFYRVFDRSFEEELREALNSDREHIKEIFHGHSALDFDLDEKKARMDENMWKVASIYRCFCYGKMRD